MVQLAVNKHTLFQIWASGLVFLLMPTAPDVFKSSFKEPKCQIANTLDMRTLIPVQRMDSSV